MRWKQIDYFPLISNSIVELSVDSNKWLSHKEIVDHLIEVEKLGDYDTVSNMVAWFSQKITQYENGNLNPNYRCYDIISSISNSYDRKVDGITYSYKRVIGTKPLIINKPKSKDELKKMEFAEFVQELKDKGIRGEEYRKAIKKWGYG